MHVSMLSAPTICQKSLSITYHDLSDQATLISYGSQNQCQQYIDCHLSIWTFVMFSTLLDIFINKNIGGFLLLL